MRKELQGIKSVASIGYVTNSALQQYRITTISKQTSKDTDSPIVRANRMQTSSTTHNRTIWRNILESSLQQTKSFKHHTQKTGQSYPYVGLIKAETCNLFVKA